MWLALALFFLVFASPAWGQTAVVVASCGHQNLPVGPQAPQSQDITGALCTNAAGGGGGGTFNGTVTQGPAGPAWNVQGTVFAKLQDALGNNITSSSNALNVNLAGSGVTLNTTVTGTVTTSVTGTVTTSDTTHFPATQALSDTLSNPTVSGIGAYALLWNATNSEWQRALVDNASGGLKVDIVAGAGGGTSSSFGSPFPATGTAAGFHNASGNMDYASVNTDATSGHDLQISCGSVPCNASDEGTYTAGTTGYSNVGCFWQTTYTTGPLTTGQAGVAQCGSKYRSLSGTLYDSLGTELDNTTAHALNAALVDSGGTSMSDATNHALITEAYTSGAAITSAFQPLVCNKTAKVHVTSGTDTQIVAASGSQTIYVCDYRFSASAALNFYLEKATSGTCATLTQIDILWTLAANQGKADAKAIYSGLNTGASAQLCVNTTAGNLDIAVNYAQF